ncbi:hypothetical protein [uncultured Psychroserpens sp.]|uniref:hypothetical protein n=1 Tax=uncultured Psychroserpens sp. TaxID=255436 RepID=UPI00262B6C36|nr:hypothetical protein [uncultured Psychroserpens sp.]
MIKQAIALCTIFLICMTVNGQELKCKKFKTGTFMIPGNENVPTTTVKRSKTSQFESISEDDFMVLDIEWIDDCNYVLKTNVEKTPAKRVTEMDKGIDKAGGLRIQMLKTVKDTMYFRAVATINGKDFPLEGIQIKVSKRYK